MVKSKNKTMVPGFHVVIEDDIQQTQQLVNLKNVVTIYAPMPEQMKSYDEDGNLELYYIEPNKPMIISSPDEAVETLAVTDLPLTREVQNIIRLIPNGSNIALVRIVKRNGETPNLDSLSEMYEALDFAFEETEQFPAKEIICAGMSLDSMVAVDSTKPLVETTINGQETDHYKLGESVKDVIPYGTIDEITDIKQFKIAIEAGRVAESTKETANDDAAFNTFVFTVDGKPAKMVAAPTSDLETVDSTKLDAKLTAVLSYTGDNAGKKEIGVTSFKVGGDGEDTKGRELIKLVDGNDISMRETIGDSFKTGSKTTDVKLQILKPIRLFVEDSIVVELEQTEFLIKAKQPEAGDALKEITSAFVTKLPDNASLLRRYLLHVHKITSFQNNCFAYLSPKPPKSLSNKDVEEYKERAGALYEKVREQAKFLSSTGEVLDLGRYLSVPLGVNMYDGIGGIVGFPQARVSTIEDSKVITKKVTSSFKKGDIVEVYSHDKMDVLVHRSRVKSVGISKINTAEITLMEPVPTEITKSRNPVYIMNVNNKDFNGTYLARQWSNVCNNAGVDRSPAGLAWPGECQLRWNQRQLNYLDYRKFAVLQQEHGSSIGAVSRSHLMTVPGNNRYQKWESMRATYELIEGAKAIAMPYKGKRISDGVDLALIRTEIEDGVFKPAIGRFITPSYELKLALMKVKNPNKLQEKALWITFTVVEIETLEAIRMRVRLN